MFERINGLGGYHRFLVIPLLLAQFRRSEPRPRHLRQVVWGSSEGLYFAERYSSFAPSGSSVRPASCGASANGASSWRSSVLLRCSSATSRRRWLPKREIVVAADSSFSALDLIVAVRYHVCFVTRLRLDANLFEPAPERRPGQSGRPPKKGRRLPKLAELTEDKKASWPGWRRYTAMAMNDASSRS